MAEVAGFRTKRHYDAPGDIGDSDGRRVRSRYFGQRAVGTEMLGRVFDGMGNLLDDGPPVEYETEMPLYADPINPLKRVAIDEPAWMGIKSIDCMITWWSGQRVGIFAGSGVGKSVTLGMMKENRTSDIT